MIANSKISCMNQKLRTIGPKTPWRALLLCSVEQVSFRFREYASLGLQSNFLVVLVYILILINKSVTTDSQCSSSSKTYSPINTLTDACYYNTLHTKIVHFLNFK